MYTAYMHTLSIAIHPCDPPVLLHNALGERGRVCVIAPHGKEKRLRAEHLHLQQQLKAELSNEAHLQLPALAYVSLGQDWSMGPHAAIESFNLSILGPKHFDLYPFYFYLDLFTLLLSLIILASGIEF